MPNTVEMILAIDSNNGIGKDGIIPWNIPDDMKFFKEKTNGHVVFMGKNTYFSLPEKHRPLKNRYNIVYTREPFKYNDDTIKYENLIFTNKKNFIDFGTSTNNQGASLALGISQQKEGFGARTSVQPPSGA